MLILLLPLETSLTIFLRGVCFRLFETSRSWPFEDGVGYYLRM